MAELEPHKHRAFLGLGSNLGNRLAFLRGGRDMLLANPEVELLQASGVYQTPAIGGPDRNPLFLNAVLEIATSLPPRQLLTVCQQTEDEFGRTRPVRWAPRTLDIDILLYADQIVAEPDLEIPHPRLHERSFVLVPLAEIAADLTCPLRCHSMSVLASRLLPASGVTLFRSAW